MEDSKVKFLNFIVNEDNDKRQVESTIQELMEYGWVVKGFSTYPRDRWHYAQVLMVKEHETKGY